MADEITGPEDLPARWAEAHPNGAGPHNVKAIDLSEATITGPDGEHVATYVNGERAEEDGGVPGPGHHVH
jgi:hypothetical protein